MKKYTLTLILLFSGLFMFAQQNVIKIGLGSALQSDLQLKYERAFAEKHSFQIGVLADFTQSYDNARLERFTQIPFTDLDPFSLSFGGFAIIPEYRYYFSKNGSPRGFYLGLYGRYRQRNGSIDSNFGTDIDLDVNATVRNVGGGIGMGAQFLIADKFSIDWYIGGLGYNQFFTSVSLAAANEDDFDRLKTDLIREINDIDTQDLGNDVPIDPADLEFLRQEALDVVNNTESDAFELRGLGFGLLDIRLGLSLGYAF